MEAEYYNNFNDFDNINIFGLDGLGCPQTVLSINNQQNNIYVPSGTVVTFKVCGGPNADFIIQDMGIGGIEGDVNLFYPYNVIDRGKLDSDGIHISSIPLNKVGTFIFRAGIWCTIADIDYCTQVSNAIIVIVMETGCTPNWQCRQPVNGYEYDANYCGAPERIASRCNPGGNGGTGDSGNTLLKIGVIIALVGGSLYLLSDKK